MRKWNYNKSSALAKIARCNTMKNSPELVRYSKVPLLALNNRINKLHEQTLRIVYNINQTLMSYCRENIRKNVKFEPSPRIINNFFNSAKVQCLTSNMVIIFEEQIFKLYILWANLLKL